MSDTLDVRSAQMQDPQALSDFTSSDHALVDDKHPPHARSRDEFGEYPLQNHESLQEFPDELDHETHVQAKATLLTDNVDEDVPDPEAYLYEHINKIIWCCTQSVQDEAEAKYILLSEFIRIGVSCLKVTDTDFHDKSASKKISDLFKKYLPPYLTVSPKMGFDMFNLSMIDFATEALPNVGVRERVVWLAKIYNRITQLKLPFEEMGPTSQKLAEMTSSVLIMDRIEAWVQHFKTQGVKQVARARSKRSRRVSVNEADTDLFDLQSTVNACNLFEIQDHSSVLLDPAFQITPMASVCGAEWPKIREIDSPITAVADAQEQAPTSRPSSPKEKNVVQPITADMRNSVVRMIYFVEDETPAEPLDSVPFISDSKQVQVSTLPASSVRPQSSPSLARSDLSGMRASKPHRRPLVKQPLKGLGEFWISLPTGAKFAKAPPVSANHMKHTNRSSIAENEFGMDAKVLAEYQPRNKSPLQASVGGRAGSGMQEQSDSTSSQNSSGDRYPAANVSEDFFDAKGNIKVFLFGEITKFIWFCVPSVKEDNDAQFILLPEFMRIGMSVLKVSTPNFNERFASKKISELFKKYLPPFLTVSATIEFEMFNLAMIDLAADAKPYASTREQILWLAKVFNRITRRKNLLSSFGSSGTTLKHVCVSDRIDSWFAHYRAESPYFDDIDEEFRLSASDLLDVHSTVAACLDFEIIEHGQVLLDYNFQTLLNGPLCGYEKLVPSTPGSATTKRSLFEVPSRYLQKSGSGTGARHGFRSFIPYVSAVTELQPGPFGLGSALSPVQQPRLRHTLERTRRCWMCGTPEPPGDDGQGREKQTRYIEQVLLKPTVVTFSTGAPLGSRWRPGRR